MVLLDELSLLDPINSVLTVLAEPAASNFDELTDNPSLPNCKVSLLSLIPIVGFVAVPPISIPPFEVAVTLATKVLIAVANSSDVAKELKSTSNVELSFLVNWIFLPDNWAFINEPFS